MYHKHREQERNKGTKELQNSQGTMSKMAVESLYLLIMTLNLNGLNSSIINIESGWVEKIVSKRFIATLKTYTEWKWKDGKKKKFCASRNQMKTGGAILSVISDKIDFNSKTVIRNKGGHYIMIMGWINQEDLTFAIFMHST